jgi:hypothetical protein
MGLIARQVSRTIRFASSALEPALKFAAQHAPFLTKDFQPGAELTVQPSMMLKPCDCEWA